MLALSLSAVYYAVIVTTLRRRVPARDVVFITAQVIVQLLNSGEITSVTAASLFLWVAFASNVVTITISSMTAPPIMAIVTSPVAIVYLPQSTCVVFATYGTRGIALAILSVAAVFAVKFTPRHHCVHVHDVFSIMMAVNARMFLSDALFATVDTRATVLELSLPAVYYAVIVTTLRRRVPARDVVFITAQVIVQLLNSGEITSVTAASLFLWVAFASNVVTITISSMTAPPIMAIVTSPVAIVYLPQSTCVVFATYGTRGIALAILSVAAVFAVKFTPRHHCVHVHDVFSIMMAVNARMFLSDALFATVDTRATVLELSLPVVYFAANDMMQLKHVPARDMRSRVCCQDRAVDVIFGMVLMCVFLAKSLDLCDLR